MISTEYIQTGEKGPQIIMHEARSTRRSLKGMVKRAFGSQKKGGCNSHAEPSTSRKSVPTRHFSPSSSTSSSRPSPYQSLRESYPEFHNLLDVSSWPSLPAPTNNLRRTPENPRNLWNTSDELYLMIDHWIASPDCALSPAEFERACPIAYHHVRGTMTGDGINDRVTREAALAEVDRVFLDRRGICRRCGRCIERYLG